MIGLYLNKIDLSGQKSVLSVDFSMISHVSTNGLYQILLHFPQLETNHVRKNTPFSTACKCRNRALCNLSCLVWLFYLFCHNFWQHLNFLLEQRMNLVFIFLDEQNWFIPVYKNTTYIFLQSLKFSVLSYSGEAHSVRT